MARGLNFFSAAFAASQARKRDFASSSPDSCMLAQCKTKPLVPGGPLSSCLSQKLLRKRPQRPTITKAPPAPVPVLAHRGRDTRWLFLRLRRVLGTLVPSRRRQAQPGAAQDNIFRRRSLDTILTYTDYINAVGGPPSPFGCFVVFLVVVIMLKSVVSGRRQEAVRVSSAVVRP